MRTPAGSVGMRLLYRYMYLYKEILAGHTYPDLQNRPPAVKAETITGTSDLEGGKQSGRGRHRQRRCADRPLPPLTRA
jgi:hypothetical protein